MDHAVALKTAMVPLTTLQFSSADLAAIHSELQQKQAEAPALFRHLPCALDLQGFSPEQLNLAELLPLCRSTGLLPVAVRNANAVWAPQLAELQLADLGRGQSRSTAPVANCPPRQVKIHSGNVRSGQQLYHDGDLVLFGMVSAGAEVLATGDIHIYGALRGRALAGVKGDENAVIVCQQFDAELLAIAGQYRLFEEPHELRQQPVAIRLQDGSLNITGV
ncbi:septum site-determining protein MinC [Venatoribacter cucullus]|uniref:septum site-determining protein MinC n=1 Tax=Venatoribacter cucullus TaxID=2661630 RepID=UPI00193861EC|nr:septum site-determining protein MinC [Venatoribacter cucullus]QQD20645.1 septum site-determining protein MinC [Oceanospirillaceae bacterium ASx5O]UZK02782.1 septum site-determining protein MinC [Venatoribacter cucullus]